MHNKCFLTMLVVVLLCFSGAVRAEDYTITVKNNRFSPDELTIPADQKIKISVKNLDATPAEFESTDLNREKIVAANGEIAVFVGPLPPGKYVYFDDFHQDTAKGLIVVR